MGGRTVRLIRDDLTALPVEAIVFYAREDLALGSGFGTAIQSRGGAAVKTDLDRIGSIAMGEAAVTTAGNLKARYIIHACGPKFHEPGLEAKLRRCISAALETAAAIPVTAIAFPPLGVGFYGIPPDICATVMLDVIGRWPCAAGTLEEITICVADGREFQAFKSKLELL